MPGAASFIPVLHSATESRPDEIDTLITAKAVAESLGRLGYATEIIALAPDLRGIETLPAQQPLLVFNLVDAVGGDCRFAPMIPARLGSFNLPYTGASTGAWLDTLSKIGTKLKLEHAGLPTPAWSEDGSGLDPEAKVIVKPVWEHGSLGLDETSVMRGADAPRAIAARNVRWRTEHFAEEYIEGREFNIALLETSEGVQVLPISEISFEGFTGRPKIVCYAAKWTPDSEAYVGTPRRFGLEWAEPVLAANLRRLTLACWSLFGLRGYARVDLRLDQTGAPLILEVNMNPCLNTDAGFAASALEAGLCYDALICRIVEASLSHLRASTLSAAVSAQSTTERAATLVVQEGGHRLRTLGTNVRSFFNGLVIGQSSARQAAPAIAHDVKARAGARNELKWQGALMADDVGRVRSLVASTGLFITAEVDVAADLVTERLAKGIRSGYSFVLAERGAALVGYACYGPIQGTKGSFDLYWIAISPEEQGRGLGAQVYARAEAAMRKAGAKHIYADTSSSERYARSRGFYQRMGFVEQARLPDFYGPGDGKIIYVKELAPIS